MKRASSPGLMEVVGEEADTESEIVTEMVSDLSDPEAKRARLEVYIWDLSIT